jgi:hypothetical protein
MVTGLRTGLQVLQDDGDPAGGNIILVSDGAENTNPLIADVKDEV